MFINVKNHEKDLRGKKKKNAVIAVNGSLFPLSLKTSQVSFYTTHIEMSFPVTD